MSPARRELLVVALAALLVLLLGSLLMLLFARSPAHVWLELLSGTLSDRSAVGQILYKATGFIFAGLAVSLALDVGLFNIAGEGQLVAGNLVAALVGLALPASTPAPIAVVLCLLAAASAGGTVGLGIGALRVYRGAHEVITSIMVNAILIGAALWLGNAVLFRGDGTRSAEIIASARLPSLGISGSSANLGLVLAVGAAVTLWLLRSRTRWGLWWRSAGENPIAAECAGVPVRKVRLLAMFASGALAGAAASSFVLGHKHAFEEGLGRGTGYLGIAVALLGRKHPLGIVAAAVMVALLSQGGLTVAKIVPKELTELLIGFSMIAVAVATAWVARGSAQARGAR
jgi:simple sugar transport system permease protein